MNGTIRKFKAAPLIVQLLTALDVWPTLTPKQRDIVASCRMDRPEDCPYDGDLPSTARDIVDPRLPGMPVRTLESLQRKGVADDRGLLTDRGVYTALWGGRQ